MLGVTASLSPSLLPQQLCYVLIAVPQYEARQAPELKLRHLGRLR